MTSKIDRVAARLRHARIARAMLAVAGAALFAGAASAATIAGTLNTSSAFSPTNDSTDGSTYYNDAYYGPLPAAPVVVGEFDFSLPSGNAVSGATISGDFGSNSLGSGTGAVELFVGNVEVANCDAACETATAANEMAWSFTFASTQLSAIGSSSLVLTAVQQEQNGQQIVLDPTSVSLTVAAVPEPAGLPMVLAAVPLLALVLRRRAQSNRA